MKIAAATIHADVIETQRLILRRWAAKDVALFARMNADPRVMEFFPALQTAEETESGIKISEEKFERFGFSFSAAELKETGEFIGFIGINVPTFEAPFMPCVEIGWRLAFEFWGKGYAQEGARACLKWGFECRKLAEIVSFTAVTNLKSRNVMERIGMFHDPAGDFDHPKVPEGHPVRRHVLYRVRSS